MWKDGLTGVQIGQGSTVVLAAGDEIRYSGTGACATRATSGGFVIEDCLGTYDPPYPVIPGGVLQVGKKFQARSIRTGKDGTRMWIDYDTRIVGREVVTVPAGTFDAYKVVVKEADQGGAHATMTLWFDPGWGFAVKRVVEYRARSSGSPQAPDIVVREMTGRTRDH